MFVYVPMKLWQRSQQVFRKSMPKPMCVHTQERTLHRVVRNRWVYMFCCTCIHAGVKDI